MVFLGGIIQIGAGSGVYWAIWERGEECAVNYNEILSGGNGVEQWGPSVLRSSPFAHRERINFFPALSSPAPTSARTPFNSTDTSSSPPSSSSPTWPWLTWRGQFFLIPCRRQCSGPGPHSVSPEWGDTQEQHSADYRTCVFSMERWPQGILRTVGCGASSQSRGPSLHRWSNYPFPQKKCTCCRVQCSRPSQCASVGPCVVRNCSLSSVFNASRVRTVFHSGCLSTRLSGKVLWGGCRRMWEQPLRKWWHLPRHGQWLHLHLSAR